ncbi:serine/threonine protein kinase [Actinomadura madurae]|nr:serine/threonine-protein kinase [Actinomadura madurae]URM94921.1 serine/threonine protein kinase [Actinomadura madurae]
MFLGVSSGGRRVAVKVIRAEHLDRPEFRARFAREVEAARKVGGFYTAQVVDADPEADEPWMSTAYIPGPSLRDVAPMPPAEVARLGAALAEGLAAIHASGLVHRDLKPGNVIMSEDGPRIIDFGVARAAEAGSLTADGAVLGTYAYMAPEQVLGERSGPPADVFALGCVLAFAATGRSPYDAATIPAIVHRVLHEEPDLAGLAEPLRPLVAACLAKDPADRPTTDLVLAHLADPETAPLAARPTPPDDDRTVERGTMQVTRETDTGTRVGRIPRRTVLVGAAAVVAAGGASGFLLTRGGERPRAVPSEAMLPPTTTLSKEGPPVEQVAFGPDGRLLACGGSQSKTVYLWDPAAGHAIHELSAPGGVAALAFSPDGKMLATGHTNSTVVLWDVEAADTRRPRALRTFRGEEAGALAFSPDGRILAGPTRLWNTTTGDVLGDLSGADGVRAVVFSRDGRRVIAGLDGDPGSVRVWDVRTRRPIMRTADRGKANSLALTPDGRTLVSAGGGATIRLWDALRVSITGVLNTGQTADITDVAVSADGKVLAAVGSDLTIRLWDLATRRPTANLAGTGERISGLALALDGRTVAAGSERRDQAAVNLWRLR